ncbi:MAG: phenylpyruvate tautomerase MIF-related protein [Pseudomonadota bacterium]
MPYLLINTNQELDKTEEMRLLGMCSQSLAIALGKPERYVMVSIESGLSMLFGGDGAPCAYLELKSLGLPEETTAELSLTLCKLIGEALVIPTERIYIEFSNPPRHMWGWNNTTF